MSSNHRYGSDFNDQPELCKCTQCGQIKKLFIALQVGNVCSVDCYEASTGKSWRSFFEPMGKELEQTLKEIRKAYA